MEKNTCCSICQKEFFKVSNLRRHTKRFHPEVYVPLPKKQFAFQCEFCGKNFSYFRNYKSHKNSHNPNPPQTKIIKNCPLCDYESDKKALYEHFEKVHQVKLVTENINFLNFESFMKWKMLLEMDKTTFIRAYSQKTKYYDEVILFVCHRSGHHYLKTKDGKTFKSDVITKKIGGFCPASIKMMKKADGSIKVLFLRTHIGHIIESNSQNSELTKKLKVIQSRHKRSLGLSPNNLLSKSKGDWEYQSEEGNEKYTISQNDNKCGYNCQYTCQDCGNCIHKFSCTCKDCSTKWNMCVHIHLLCKVLRENQVEQPREEPDKQEEQQLKPIEEQQSVPEQMHSNIDITDLIIYDVQNEQPSTSSIIEEVPQAPPEIPIEEKNSILHEFSNILTQCNSAVLFQDIIKTIGEWKSRLECQEMPLTSENGFTTR